MDKDEYDKVELPALEQLQQLGWHFLPGAALAPLKALDPLKAPAPTAAGAFTDDAERGSYRDVILDKRLTTAVQRINPWISAENLRKVVREITHPNYATLMEANLGLWQTLVQYQSVEQDLGKGRKGQTVKIIDFENRDNNEFLCTNQFKIEGINQNIIPDILLFVNGIPLGVIECKSPYITNPMESGIDQLMRYANRRNSTAQEGVERLFWYNQFMISTHRDKARVATISSRVEHYLEWKDAYPFTVADVGENPTSQDMLIAGLLSPSNCLDMVQNFTLFEPIQGKMVKKIARYQQFRAVHKTLQRLKNGATKKDKGGVIWHTQGSGKSLTMVMLAIKMRRDPKLRDYKLVFITDRTQLDQQLTAQFERAQGEAVYNAGSVAELKQILARESSDLVTCMVQKFQEGDELDFPVLNTSAKIVVMADEAHRTQYGSLGVAINTGLPNAPKIAFTGTPLITSQKTHQEFGGYIDTYTIEQAVADGATCQILYEGRAAATKVTGDSLDKLFDEYFGDRPPEERQAIKKKFGTEQAVLEAPQRIRWVCIDLLKHYREHIQPNGFKAMIVTSSRRAAVTYKKMLDELDGPDSEVIISGTHNDHEMFTPFSDATKHKQAIDNFCKPLTEQPLSILVVKDMLLTGFDAPICQVMYLDRKLKDHSLLQAIARVNRTHTGKSRGFIVDYYGLSDYLWEALELFSNEDVQGAMKNLKDEIPKLKATHTRVMAHFKGMDVTDTDACVLSLEDEDKRQQFEIDFKKFAQQLDIIMPDTAASPYLGDLKYLGKINQAARNLYRDEQLNLAGVGEKVRKLIEEHLHATGIDPKIPPVDLFAVDFKTTVEEHKSSRTKASEIEHAIKHHIRINLEEDEEYYKSLSAKLNKILQQKAEHWDELAQMLFDFRDNMEKDRKQAADDLGLNGVEFAFHNIMVAEIARVTGEDSIPEATHDEVLAVTRELVAMLDEATKIVDFFNKHDEIKSMRKKIKHTIGDSSFDDTDLRNAVMDRFMDLAQVKFR